MAHKRRAFITFTAAFAAITPSVVLLSANAEAATTSTVTLSLFNCDSCVPYAWQISDFEKAYPSIRINLSEVPFGDFYTKEGILAASSSPPDVYDVDQPTIANLAAAGALLPLNKYLPASYISGLNPAAVKEFSYNGQLYSPGPSDTDLALYYNKNLLAKTGIHPPTSLSSAWTWQQALSAMESCQQGPKDNPTIWGLAPPFFGNGVAGFDYYSILFLRSEGSPNAPASSPLYKTFVGIAPNDSTVDGYVNSPEAVAGASVYQDIYQKDHVSPTSGNPDAFIDGKACFMMQTSTYIASMNQAHVNFGWGVTPFPYIKTPVVHTGTDEVAVSSKTKHLQQALDFVKFVSSPSQQEQIITQDGYLPVLKSLYNNAVFKSAPWDIFVQELAKWGVPRPVTPHYLQYSNVLTKAMTNIADGTSPSSALNQAAEQMDELLRTPAGAI
ncbi:MAG TPA: extracellular solute-binding protein [Acidimicrobiales bacterium]|nr:extracellular solute-binding protein [Acidimicrobiales bacterium]